MFFGGAGVVDIYDASSGTWSTTTPLSVTRYSLAATSAANMVFFGGGESSGGASSVVDVYNGSSGALLSSSPSLSVPREQLAAGSVGNKVLFAGGYTGGGPSNVVDIYDTSTGIWSTTTPLSVARYCLAAASAGNQVFFAGGYGYNSFPVSTVDIYTLQHYATITTSQNFALQDNTTVDGLMQINAGSLSLTGFNLAVGSMSGVAPINLTGGLLTIGSDNTNRTYSGAISGGGSLTKLGSGTLVFSSPNGYMGTTLVSNGTLLLANAAALSGSTFDTSGGGSLSFGTLTSATFGGLQGSGSLTLNNASAMAVSLDVGGNNANTTFSGGLGGSGSLNKIGGGTLVLAGSNAYIGGTTILAGAISLNNANAVQYGTLTVSVNNGLLFNSNSGAIATFNAGGLAGSGNIGLADGGYPVTLSAGRNGISTTYSGTLSGSGGLTKTGSGAFVLAAANTFSGLTTISAGTLQLGDGNTANGSVAGNIVNNAALVFANPNPQSYSGIVSGTGSLAEGSASTLTLGAANTFNGPTYVNAGTIQLAHPLALQNSTVYLTGGALNKGSASATLGGLAGWGNLDIGLALTFGGNNQSTTYSGNLTSSAGNGALTKTGNGLVVLQGVDTYTGGTTVSGGTLQGNTTSLLGNFTNNAALVFDQALDANYGGAVTGGGTLAKINYGALTLSGNILNNVSVQAGRLIAGPGSLVSGNASISAGAMFANGGGDIHLYNLVNNGVLAGNAQISGTMANQSSGDMRIGAGQSVLVDGASAQSNAGLIEAIGTANAVGGEANFECYGPLTNVSRTGLITGRNATLRFDGGLTNQGSVGLSAGYTDVFGKITNTGNISIAGGASVTFYDDVTQNGALVVSSAGGVQSSAVFFGAFTGSGGVTGGGSVFLMGDLRPGNSPAEVTMNCNVTLAPSVDTVMELGGLTAGSQHDKLDVPGSLALAGNLDVVLIDGFDPQLGNQFDLFDGNVSGTFDSISLPALDPGLSWDTSKLYTSGEISVVPEPGSACLAAASIGIAAAWLSASNLRRRSMRRARC